MRVEHLYTVVVPVYDVDVVLAVDCYGPGVVEMPIDRPGLPDRLLPHAQCVVLVKTVVVTVRDPQVAVAVDGHAARVVHLAATAAPAADRFYKLARLVVLPDSVIAIVCPVEITRLLVYRNAAVAGVIR